METLRELYKIGVGPSSSHTMGPQRICFEIKQKYPNANRYEVYLHGSLALTGKGHLTDYIIIETLKPALVNVHWQIQALPKHPNGMIVQVYENEVLLDTITAYSVGGGSVVYENEDPKEKRYIYQHDTFSRLKDFLEGTGLDLYEYILQTEGADFQDYLEKVLDAMFACIKRGLNAEGILPGKLCLKRVAKKLHEQASEIKNMRLLVTSYAYAVSEENASGGVIVTAPTCGASGVLPAVLYYAHHDLHYPKMKCIEALAIGGIIGNFVKTNATISGAEGGCQAEVGTATAMAAAAYASLCNLPLSDIEYAAEMGLEHQLGLTCDPVGGYVQIPCIERNGFGALRAIDAAIYARELSKIRKHRVSLDSVIRVMKKTGKDLNEAYRETSLGGLASELKVD